jgi:D-alanine-D-alanine ligase
MAKKKFSVGFTYNVAPSSDSYERKTTSDPHDFNLKYGEWDSQETIEGVIKGLEKSGNRVIPIEAVNRPGIDAYALLKKHKKELDIVFNIAEGVGGKANRESHLPIFLEYLDIPHTGSDGKALSIGLDKATTIEILKSYGINVASHYVFQNLDDAREIQRYAKNLERIFPLFVKPVAEGTSVGMSQDSVVETMEHLRAKIEQVITEYKQPALVQPFLSGREHTVGILGDIVLPILSIDLNKIPEQPKVRDEHVKEIDTAYSAPKRFNEKYVLLAAQAAITQNALGFRDYNRMDFREDEKGKIYFLEVNPLPGLNPSSSDFPKIAGMAGISYDVLVNAVLMEAIKRYQSNSSQFRERFPDERVSHIRAFIEPSLAKLDFYPMHVAADMPGLTYKLAKVKKNA